MASATRVMGIDPGSHRTGWGVIEASGPRMAPVAGGIVELKSSDAFALRLRKLFEQLQDIIGRYRPNVIAIEDIFHARHPQSSLKLGHARGVILLCASLSEAGLFEYSPALVKKTLTGSGRADKEQVARIVSAFLSISTKLPVDATDAFAVAITHARASSLLSLSKRASRTTSRLL